MSRVIGVMSLFVCLLAAANAVRAEIYELPPEGYDVIGTVATVLISLLIVIMVRFDMFGHEIARQVLKVRLPSDMPYGTLFTPLFDRYLRSYDLVAVETVQASTATRS